MEGRGIEAVGNLIEEIVQKKSSLEELKTQYEAVKQKRSMLEDELKLFRQWIKTAESQCEAAEQTVEQYRKAIENQNKTIAALCNTTKLQADTYTQSVPSNASAIDSASSFTGSCTASVSETMEVSSSAGSDDRDLVRQGGNPSASAEQEQSDAVASAGDAANHGPLGGDETQTMVTMATNTNPNTDSATLDLDLFEMLLLPVSTVEETAPAEATMPMVTNEEAVDTNNASDQIPVTNSIDVSRHTSSCAAKVVRRYRAKKRPANLQLAGNPLALVNRLLSSFTLMQLKSWFNTNVGRNNRLGRYRQPICKVEPDVKVDPLGVESLVDCPVQTRRVSKNAAASRSRPRPTADPNAPGCSVDNCINLADSEDDSSSVGSEQSDQSPSKKAASGGELYRRTKNTQFGNRQGVDTARNLFSALEEVMGLREEATVKVEVDEDEMSCQPISIPSPGRADTNGEHSADEATAATAIGRARSGSQKRTNKATRSADAGLRAGSSKRPVGRPKKATPQISDADSSSTARTSRKRSRPASASDSTAIEELQAEPTTAEPSAGPKRAKQRITKKLV